MHVGDAVDDFEAVDQDGTRVSLSSMLEHGPVVLYWYIKAATPG